MESTNRGQAGPHPDLETRHLGAAGWSYLALGDARKGDEYLRRVVAAQFTDPNDPLCSSWPWQVGHTDIKDDNAIDFAVSFLVPALLRYPDKLSAEFMQGLPPAPEGRHRRRAPPQGACHLRQYLPDEALQPHHARRVDQRRLRR